MERRGALLIFAAGVLWGTIGFFLRMMAQSGSTSQLTSFLRMLFAFVIMIVLTIAKFGLKSLKISGKTLFQCALLGIICHGVYNIFYSYAVAELGMTISCVLMNTAPVFTAAASFIFFKERPGAVKWAALAVNIVGCVLAATGGKFEPKALSVAGILCGIGSGFCYGMTAILGKNAGEKDNAFVVSTYSYLFAAVFVGVFMLPFSEPAELNPGILVWGALLALIPTGIAYILYYNGLKLMTETSRVPVIASGECVVAAIIGIAFFREPLELVNIIGILLVIGSIAMMSLKPRKADSKPHK